MFLSVSLQLCSKPLFNTDLWRLVNDWRTVGKSSKWICSKFVVMISHCIIFKVNSVVFCVSYSSEHIGKALVLNALSNDSIGLCSCFGNSLVFKFSTSWVISGLCFCRRPTSKYWVCPTKDMEHNDLWPWH